jgi:hypothetical protein
MSRPIVFALVLAAALPAAALAQQKPAPAKKPSTAECTLLLDPFRNKQNAAVKDADVQEYAPLVKSFWKKSCPASLYEQEIPDADLRKRVEAVAPRPKPAAAKKS